jgi:hypothetical protein
MIGFVRRVVLVVAIGSTALLPACNDETLPTPIPTPQTSVRGIVASTSFTDFPTDVYLGIPIPLEQPGALDFTVDWTFPDTYMEVAFGSKPCTFQELNARTCPFDVKSQGTTPKPRFLVTPPVRVGTYFLYLYSKPWTKKDGLGSENVEAVALQIGLTVGPTVTPASAQIAPIRLGAPVVLK